MATVIPVSFRFPSLPAGLRGLSSRTGLLLHMLLLCFMAHAPAAVPEDRAAPVASEAGEVERAVKAAYLYKFLGYVEWPPAQLAQAGAPFLIGVAGNDKLADEVERVAAGRLVNGRTLAVRRVQPDDSLTGLHLLYIGTADSARQQRLLKLVQQRPVLTVTDSEPSGRGAIINFKTVDNRVRFEVALGAAEKSGLQLSSRLLSVALKVQAGGAS